MLDLAGRATRWVCWAFIVLVFFQWIVIPLVNLYPTISNPHVDFALLFHEIFWGEHGEKFVGILVPLVIFGVGLKAGTYLQESPGI